MILADTSVWIDHLRNRNPSLEALLDQGQVLSHPFIVGELALGSLRQRKSILSALQNLPQVTVAHDSEVLSFIDSERLFATGTGYIDAHLLASVVLTPGTLLWTLDKRLRVIAERLGLHASI